MHLKKDFDCLFIFYERDVYVTFDITRHNPIGK